MWDDKYGETEVKMSAEPSSIQWINVEYQDLQQYNGNSGNPWSLRVNQL